MTICPLNSKQEYLAFFQGSLGFWIQMFDKIVLNMAFKLAYLRFSIHGSTRLTQPNKYLAVKNLITFVCNGKS